MKLAQSTGHKRIHILGWVHQVLDLAGMELTVFRAAVLVLVWICGSESADNTSVFCLFLDDVCRASRLFPQQAGVSRWMGGTQLGQLI